MQISLLRAFTTVASLKADNISNNFFVFKIKMGKYSDEDVNYLIEEQIAISLKKKKVN